MSGGRKEGYNWRKNLPLILREISQVNIGTIDLSKFTPFEPRIKDG